MKRKIKGKTVLLATHNEGKVEEIAALLGPLNLNLVNAKQLQLVEPKETSNTFAGNARIKAHAAAKTTNLPALSDDSGIEVDALDGAPGVYTADWAETENGRDFIVAMEKTHKMLTELGASPPWRACFRCTMVIAWPDGYDMIFEGKMEGTVVWPMRGSQGHGYDPIFKPLGSEITFGEMDRWEKNRISHRAIACEKFCAFFA